MYIYIRTNQFYDLTNLIFDIKKGHLATIRQLKATTIQLKCNRNKKSRQTKTKHEQTKKAKKAKRRSRNIKI